MLLEVLKPERHWWVAVLAADGGLTAARLAPHVAQVVAVDCARDGLGEPAAANIAFGEFAADHLPFAAESLDCVLGIMAAHRFRDSFAFVQEAERVLKSGGHLLVHERIVPEDRRDAQYVDAFEKLQNPAFVSAVPEYQWRADFVDGGFDIVHCEHRADSRELRLQTGQYGQTPQTVERLHILLLRAPATVQAWLQPDYAGTAFARYTDHRIIIMGRKY